MWYMSAQILMRAESDKQFINPYWTRLELFSIRILLVLRSFCLRSGKLVLRFASSSLNCSVQSSLLELNIRKARILQPLFLLRRNKGRSQKILALECQWSQNDFFPFTQQQIIASLHFLCSTLFSQVLVLRTCQEKNFTATVLSQTKQRTASTWFNTRQLLV